MMTRPLSSVGGVRNGPDIIDEIPGVFIIKVGWRGYILSGICLPGTAARVLVSDIAARSFTFVNSLRAIAEYRRLLHPGLFLAPYSQQRPLRKQWVFGMGYFLQKGGILGVSWLKVAQIDSGQ
eukprot:3807916-Prymnesium_polylepis.1